MSSFICDVCGAHMSSFICDVCGAHMSSLILTSLLQTYYKRRMTSSRMLRRVALVRTDVSEELSTSIIRVASYG
jgi:predicted amidophosphoribosyltransferase